MFRSADWSLPTFRDNLSVPFLRVQQSKNVKNGYFVQIIHLFLDRTLLEKLTIPHLAKELPASYRTQNSLPCSQKPSTGTSWATRTIPHTTSHHIYDTFPLLSKWSLAFGISHQNRASTFLFHACYTPRLSHPKPLSMPHEQMRLVKAAHVHAGGWGRKRNIRNPG